MCLISFCIYIRFQSVCVWGGGDEEVFSWVCKMWIGLGRGHVLREIKTGENNGVVPLRDTPVWNRSKLI